MDFAFKSNHLAYHLKLEKVKKTEKRKKRNTSKIPTIRKRWKEILDSFKPSHMWSSKTCNFPTCGPHWRTCLRLHATWMYLNPCHHKKTLAPQFTNDVFVKYPREGNTYFQSFSFPLLHYRVKILLRRSWCWRLTGGTTIEIKTENTSILCLHVAQFTLRWCKTNFKLKKNLVGAHERGEKFNWMEELFRDPLRARPPRPRSG